ncbi:hypothetical protein F5Y18DRAFT_379681 [Xylariaceae sp. FL1019]|nr:hypothetical protein F5Y18DRAFT_379681 [Xylariaceae sp. FL1019]
MDTASPAKRRALADIDANTRSPLTPSRQLNSKPEVLKTNIVFEANCSPTNLSKRPAEKETERESPLSTKKRRLGPAEPERPSSISHEKPTTTQQSDGTVSRPRSISPDDSTMIDDSTLDHTQFTAITEPEVESPAPMVTESRPRQGSLTREEARQKAEILRLRLGLASYKVRTNQTNVPLERLQVRPLPRLRPTQRDEEPTLPPLPASARAASKARSIGTRVGESWSGEASPTAPVQSRRRAESCAGGYATQSYVHARNTESTRSTATLSQAGSPLKDKEELVSGELAVKGLLSLSQER